LESPPTWLAACPQMHGTGMWLGTMVPLLLKGSVVTLVNRSFDAHELWQAVERNAVDVVVIVGDAFAKPMLRALDEGIYEAPSVKVITEDGREVQPGSDEIGMVAAVSASLGYFKDPEKSERTFKIIDGVAHSLPGDWAKVAEDGSLILLGRGSNSINTGGEK